MPVFGGPDPLLNIGASAPAAAGDTVYVPVNLDHSDGLDAVELSLSYDSSRLAVADVQPGSLTAGFGFDVQVDDTAGTIRISAGHPAGPVHGLGSGGVAVIGFKVKDDAPAGAAV